ncbi:MAG: hypothetical protein H3C39_11340 [Flavobacteriia bacterium]|nr:hypothetical protein [Flavobacteriia bacterium]
MPRIDKLRVDEIIRDGYGFELGDYISSGFNEFKKEWLLYSLYGLVAVIIMILSLFTIVGFIFLFYPTMLGFAVASDKRQQTGVLNFSDFFGAFKNFGSYAVVGLLVFAAYLLVYVPMFALLGFSGIFMGDHPELGMISMFGSMIFVFLGILLVYFVMIGLFFAPYLIHYGGYSGTEAVRASFKLAFRNFWWLLLFVIITGVIGGIGQYLCLIGLFASMAAASLMNYAMIKRVLMVDAFNEIDEIGNPNI